MKPNRSGDDLLTVLDIADWLGVHENTAYKVVRYEDFPEPVIVEKSRRWFFDELVKWARKNRKAA